MPPSARVGGTFLCIQSLHLQSQSVLSKQQKQQQQQQLSQSHIPIHHSKVQVTVNPSNGKRERVFVDLRVVYPTPDEPGTELSFEEVWAATRGWLGVQWEEEEEEQQHQQQQQASFVDENSSARQVNALKVSQKLAVHQDVVRLDENGAPIYPGGSKPRKKKPVEMNETQISTLIYGFYFIFVVVIIVIRLLTPPSQSKAGLAVRAKDQEETTVYGRADDDAAHQGGH